MEICNASSTNKTEELQSKSVRSGVIRVILIEREAREIEGGRKEREAGEGKREGGRVDGQGVLSLVSHINN